MTLQLPDLTQLSATNVQNRLTTLSGIISSLDVGIDTSRGVFRDLVLRYQAILQEAADNVLQSTLVSAVPALALSYSGALDEDVLISVGTTYGVTRYTSAQSTGSVTIVLSSSATVFIPQGSTFVAGNGQSFVTTTAFALKTTESNITYANERKLNRRVDGNYEAFIELTSNDSSASANVQAGELFTPTSISLPNLVSVTARSDFYGGADEETLNSYIARLVAAVPAKTMSTRSSVVSFLSQPDAFPGLKAVSVIGAGDIEMHRDQRTMFPGGNKVDIYVRTATNTVTKAAELTATATEVVDGGKAVWTLTIDRDTFPGFYRVADVQWIDDLTTTPEDVTVVFGKDMTNVYGEQTPGVYLASEAAFSRYQTATVTFTTPSAGYTVGQSGIVSVSIEGMPDIDKIQTLVSSRSYRFATGDTLVKAAMPCFVSTAIRINVRAGVTPPDTSEMQGAVASFINDAGFAGEIYSASVAGIVQPFLPAGAYVAGVDLIAEYIRPDGSILRKRSSDVISALHEYDSSVSNRTTVFITNAAAIQFMLYEQQFAKVV